GFVATVAAAEAGALLQFGFLRPRQRVVAPFAGYAVGAGQQLAVHAYAGGAAGAQYGGGYGAVVAPCSACGFGERQAVGVGGQGYGPVQSFSPVLLQGLAVQPGGVGVFDTASFAGNAAGYAYAYRYAGGAGVGFGLFYQGVDGVQGGLVIAGWSGHTFAEVFVGLVIQQDHFGFSAAQVYAC